MQEIVECHAGSAHLAKLHDKQAAQHELLRQKHHDQSKRAGKIIADNAHKFTGKVSGPVVENAAVAPERITKCFKIVDVLSVQVEAKHGFFAKGVESEDGIRQIGQRSRNGKGDEIDPVSDDPSSDCRENAAGTDTTLGTQRHGLGVGGCHGSPP